MNQGFFVVGKGLLSTNHLMRERLKQRTNQRHVYDRVWCRSRDAVSSQACMHVCWSVEADRLSHQCMFELARKGQFCALGISLMIKMFTLFVDKRKVEKTQRGYPLWITSLIQHQRLNCEPTAK